MNMLPGSITTETSENLRAIVAPKWDGARNEVIAYRDEAIEAQQFKCAYCQREIIRNELGHRELDHVLPKSQRPKENFDVTLARSILSADRRHTRGYPDFRHEPKNLVVTCKRCNAYKGSYDCLADRSAAPSSYPQHSDDFEWVHPYYDNYFLHLAIEDGVLFKSVNGSKKGDAVIAACGLDKIDQLIERVIADHVAKSVDIGIAMMRIVMRESVFDSRRTAQSIVDHFGKGSVDVIADYLIELQSCEMMGTAKLVQVLNDFLIDEGKFSS